MRGGGHSGHAARVAGEGTVGERGRIPRRLETWSCDVLIVQAASSGLAAARWTRRADPGESTPPRCSSA